MIRSLLACLAIVVLVGCARHEEPSVAMQDSLLSTPATADTHSHSVSLGNGLIVDSSRIAPATVQNTLARFSPKQVLAIYEGYRPLRRQDVAQSQVDSFLRAQKITLAELHTVLEQGDRLGWSLGSSPKK